MNLVMGISMLTVFITVVMLLLVIEGSRSHQITLRKRCANRRAKQIVYEAQFYTLQEAEEASRNLGPISDADEELFDAAVDAIYNRQRALTKET